MANYCINIAPYIVQSLEENVYTMPTHAGQFFIHDRACIIINVTSTRRKVHSTFQYDRLVYWLSVTLDYDRPVYWPSRSHKVKILKFVAYSQLMVSLMCSKWSCSYVNVEIALTATSGPAHMLP